MDHNPYIFLNLKRLLNLSQDSLYVLAWQVRREFADAGSLRVSVVGCEKQGSSAAFRV